MLTMGWVEKGGYIKAGKEGQGGDTEARATTQEDQNMKPDPSRVSEVKQKGEHSVVLEHW